MDMSKEPDIFDEFEDELRGFMEDFVRLKKHNDELMRVNRELESKMGELEALLDELDKKLKNIQWMVRELENGRKG